MKPALTRLPLRHACSALVLGLALSVWAGAAPAVVFYVNSAADKVDINPGDGICDADPGAATECTLRAAVMEANALPNDAGTRRATTASAFPAATSP